jgi:hypothetical protein
VKDVPNNENNQEGSPGTPIDSWAMWQRLILSEIKQNKIDNKNNSDEINKLKIAMAIMQTKAAIIGLIVGAASSAVTVLLIEWFFGALKSGLIK